MARYIDAEELKQERDMAIKAYENANIFTAKAIREHIKPLLDKIVDTPTADVVEVVRCKNCKKWTTQHTCDEFIADRKPLRGFTTFITEANDFCSYGERKEK